MRILFVITEHEGGLTPERSRDTSAVARRGSHP